MKNRKAIFIAGMLVVLGAAKLASASDNSIAEPSKLLHGYSAVSEVIQITKTENISKKIIKSKKAMLVPQKKFTVEELRYLYGKCGEYYNLAIDSGWKKEQWSRLSYIIDRESGCDKSAFNKSDPMGGSRGLTQINGFWCSKNKYSKAGFLQDNSILSKCEDLFITEVNLKAALVIYNYSQNKNKCGWRPWSMNCK